ncbi:MAG: sarcosine oxidase subunit delta [Alphaproteobacteria bacterium]|jgi:heterotetrameric sarcosine oxidase delta subunit
MLLLDCPWCGPRSEEEFACGGEGHIARPLNSENMDDAAWGDYVFMRSNHKGVYFERWRHGLGCGRWFNVARSTISHEILAIYHVGDAKPELPE